MRAVKTVLGWREWVDLPDLGLECIQAKVDTGARTSALHAERLTYIRGGVGRVRFSVVPGKNCPTVQCEASVVDRRVVRDSGGHDEERYVIETDLRIGDRRWPIEITLTDRARLVHALLLGRTAIRRRFLVDPGRSYAMKKERG